MSFLCMKKLIGFLGDRYSRQTYLKISEVKRCRTYPFVEVYDKSMNPFCREAVIWDKTAEVHSYDG